MSITRFETTIDLWLVDVNAAAQPLANLEAAGHLIVGATPDLVPVPASLAPSPIVRQTAQRALRAVLGRHLAPGAEPVHLERLPNGALKVVGANLKVSLSHTGETALVGVSPVGPFGLDLESARALKLNDSRRTDLVRLAVALKSSADGANWTTTGLKLPIDDQTVLLAWVLIEAVAKARGLGVAQLLAATGWRGHPLLVRETCDAFVADHPLSLSFLALPEPFVGAMAAPSPLPTWSLREFPVSAAELEQFRLDRPAGTSP